MLDAILSWDTLWWVMIVLYVPACFSLIVIVLLQKGKGTGFAGAFGVGAGPGSDTVFGPKATRTLPVRLTYIAATIFMLIAVIMSVIAGRVGKGLAPELADDTPGGAATVDVGLGDLGVGTGLAGAAAEITGEETPAGEEDPAAVVTDEEPAELPEETAAEESGFNDP